MLVQVQQTQQAGESRGVSAKVLFGRWEICLCSKQAFKNELRSKQELIELRWSKGFRAHILRRVSWPSGSSSIEMNERQVNSLSNFKWFCFNLWDNMIMSGSKKGARLHLCQPDVKCHHKCSTPLNANFLPRHSFDSAALDSASEAKTLE